MEPCSRVDPYLLAYMCSLSGANLTDLDRLLTLMRTNLPLVDAARLCGCCVNTLRSSIHRAAHAASVLNTTDAEFRDRWEWVPRLDYVFYNVPTFWDTTHIPINRPPQPLCPMFYCGHHRQFEISFVVGVTHRGAICGSSWWYPVKIHELDMQQDVDAHLPYFEDEYRCGDGHYRRGVHFIAPLSRHRGGDTPLVRLWNGKVRQKRQVVERAIGSLKRWALLAGGRHTGRQRDWDFIAQCFQVAINFHNLEIEFNA